MGVVGNNMNDDNFYAANVRKSLDNHKCEKVFLFFLIKSLAGIHGFL